MKDIVLASIVDMYMSSPTDLHKLLSCTVMHFATVLLIIVVVHILEGVVFLGSDYGFG